MPGDRHKWSDEQGKRERKGEDINLPGPEWRLVVTMLFLALLYYFPYQTSEFFFAFSCFSWQDDWHVDMAYGEVGIEIDREGWTYGEFGVVMP